MKKRNIDVQEADNKALHLTAIPLRSIAASEGHVGIEKMRREPKINRHPDPIFDAAIDRLAHATVQNMPPGDVGLMLYPNAKRVSLPEVPGHIVADHLNRYTQSDLETGQFLEVLPGKFTFIMSHETKKRKESEASHT